MNLPAFIKPINSPRSFIGAQWAIITDKHGHIVPCASPTINWKTHRIIQCAFAPIGISKVNKLEINIAPPNINLAPNRPAKYPAGIWVTI